MGRPCFSWPCGTDWGGGVKVMRGEDRFCAGLRMTSKALVEQASSLFMCTGKCTGKMPAPR